MSKKGVPIVFISCLVLVWLFGGQPVKKIDPIPADGLIEAVASVKQSLQVEPSGNSGQFNHIGDANKMVGNSSEIPNSSPSPSDRHEKARREIVIFTRPNCPPCDRWKRCEQAKFEADGWAVAYCDNHSYPLTPTFLIDANNKQTEHRGYLPFEKLKEVLK